MTESQTIEYKESRGRGIERILESCKSAGLSEPMFRNEGNGLWVEFMYSKAQFSGTGVTTQEMI